MASTTTSGPRPLVSAASSSCRFWRFEWMVCVAPGVDEAALESLLPVLGAELNIKRIELASSGDSLVTLEAKANFRALGKKFGKKTPLAAQAVTAFTSAQLRDFLSGAPVIVSAPCMMHLKAMSILSVLLC